MNPKQIRDTIERALNIAAVTNIGDALGMQVDADEADSYIPFSEGEGGAFLLITDADGSEFLVSVMRAKKEAM